MLVLPHLHKLLSEKLDDFFVAGPGLIKNTQEVQGLFHRMITPGTDIEVELGVVNPCSLGADVLGRPSIELVDDDFFQPGIATVGALHQLPVGPGDSAYSLGSVVIPGAGQSC
jgi:hypothetical protein